MWAGIISHVITNSSVGKVYWFVICPTISLWKYQDQIISHVSYDAQENDKESTLNCVVILSKLSTFNADQGCSIEGAPYQNYTNDDLKWSGDDSKHTWKFILYL